MQRLLAFVSDRLLRAAGRGDVAILLLIVAILSLLVLPLSFGGKPLVSSYWARSRKRRRVVAAPAWRRRASSSGRWTGR